MRKEYHPNRYGEEVRIWDVNRLVRLAEALPERNVPLSAIWELDRVRWFVEEKHQPTCRAVLEHMRRVMAADPRFPILLGEDGRVMDGMHRVLKVALDGGTEIRAKQFETDLEPDYVDVDLDDLPY